MSRQRPPEPGAGPAVEGYLAEVKARLPGPARTRTGIVAELRSGLLDATDAHRSAGLPPPQAALAAIHEFGDPVQVAVGFRAEIAANLARRVAVTLLVTGPLVGFLWIAAAAASHLGISLAPPWPWTGLSPGVSVSIYLVAVAAGSPLGPRYSVSPLPADLPAGCPPDHAGLLLPRQSRGFGAVSADGLGLALLATQLAVARGRLSPIPAAAAAAASLARMMLARRAARQCLAIRASLT